MAFNASALYTAEPPKPGVFAAALAPDASSLPAFSWSKSAEPAPAAQPVAQVGLPPAESLWTAKAGSDGLNGGILKVFDATVRGVPDAVADIAGAMKSSGGEASAAESVNPLRESASAIKWNGDAMVAAAMALFSSEAGGKGAAQAAQPAMVAASVSPEDLSQMAAPTFGTKAPQTAPALVA